MNTVTLRIECGERIERSIQSHLDFAGLLNLFSERDGCNRNVMLSPVHF